MVWGFLFYFVLWTCCWLHLEHFNLLDTIFEQKFSPTNFPQNELRWKKGVLKLFYQFQTFKQHWNILIGDPQGNITQFGYNLSTRVDCQAEKQPEWWWEFFFFNLAETKYKIKFCKVSKLDLHLWSSDSSSEASLRQSLSNRWAVCFGKPSPQMYTLYSQAFQWFIFQFLAPTPARKRSWHPTKLMGLLLLYLITWKIFWLGIKNNQRRSPREDQSACQLSQVSDLQQTWEVCGPLGQGHFDEWVCSIGTWHTVAHINNFPNHYHHHQQNKLSKWESSTFGSNKDVTKWKSPEDKYFN